MLMPLQPSCCTRTRRSTLAACVCSCICSLCLSAPAWADPPSSTISEEATRTISPPKLLERVQLNYPEAALSEQLHGDVSVLVSVDATGAVTQVTFESGPEVFRAATLEAGERLTFTPAKQGGSTVPATTRVRFHFAPPVELTEAEPGEIVVHGTNPDQEGTRSRTTLDEADLERSAGNDLAETISQVSGVRMATGTADASKPIIRGHRERRLLVLNDGVRHESQK